MPVKKQMIEWFGPIIHEYYAGTEGNGFVYCNSDMWLAHEGTVGTPINCIVHICGDDGEELPARRVGHHLLRGRRQVRVPQRPGEDEGLAAPEAGWTTLGDVGYLDDDNFLYLTDRKAYMIISGGVNIYPQEAENVLVDAPEGGRRRRVRRAQRRLRRRGEGGRPAGRRCRPTPRQPPRSPQELIAFCREHLADVKCPRSIDFREELPRHPTGKLYKRLLKDEYWAAAGRSI